MRVEGKNKTLLAQTAPLSGLATLSRGGHSCTANTGAAALQAATHGSWGGTWSSQYKDFEITKIKGETDSYSATKSYWEVFVDDKPASTGVCNLKLKGSDEILFAAVGNSEKPGSPIAIKAITPATSETAGQVVAVAYSSKGKAAPLAGATVTVGGKNVGKTNAKGIVNFEHASGTVVVSKTGYIRDEQAAQA